MRKVDEVTDGSSCLNRASPDELLFVLMARDAAAPATIRFWAAERVRLKRNQVHDHQIHEALKCAQAMESERRAREVSK